MREEGGRDSQIPAYFPTVLLTKQACSVDAQQPRMTEVDTWVWCWANVLSGAGVQRKQPCSDQVLLAAFIKRRSLVIFLLSCSCKGCELLSISTPQYPSASGEIQYHDRV
jgi:hypothetical protein